MIILCLINLVSGCYRKLEFTECSNNTRAAIFYPQNCNTTEPSVYFNLPCNFTCDAGSALNFNETSKSLKCSLCPSGTFSIGGGHQYNTWNNFKEDFHSYCWVLEDYGWELDVGCTPWHSSSETLLVTGTAALKNWYETDFTFYPTLVKDGHVEITYMKESGDLEGYQIGDFYIFIDETLSFYDFSGNNPNWRTIKLPLSKGMRKVQIVFDKMVSEEVSEAKIRSIEVRGSDYADLYCRECPVGHSGAGSDICLDCEVGSYLYQVTSICKECPKGTTSKPGSIGVESCFEPEACVESGWHYYFSDCEGGKQKKVFEWNEPLFCNPKDKTLPADEVVDCINCGAGREYVDSQCQYCQLGFYSTSARFEEKCLSCPAGTYTLTRADLYDWTEFPEGLISNCLKKDQISCAYDWELRGTYLTTSSVYFPESTITLEGTFEATEYDSTISFNYAVKGSQTEFAFYINGKKVLSSVGNLKNETTFAVNKRENTYKWACIHSANQEESCEIHRITLTGNKFGGGIRCLDCPDGSISKGLTNQCEACPEGKTSNYQRTECIYCAQNSFKDLNNKCKPCPKGMSSTSDKQSCILLNDTVELDHSTYVLQNLTGNEQQVPFYCTEPKLQMYCYESFFGPVEGNSHFFYLSVLTPSKVLMPSYSQLFEGDAYAFAVINTAKLNIEQVSLNKPGEECEVNSLFVVVNIGREVKEIKKNDSQNKTGFEVTYNNGDFCQNDNLFSTNIRFICAKEEDEGWPIFQRFENCTFYFNWPTVHACELCTGEMKVSHSETCKDGKRTVHVFEGDNCIFLNRMGHTETVETCSHKAYTSWPFILSIVLCVILFLIVIVLVVLVIKKRSGIKRLIQYRTSEQEVEMAKK